MLRPPPLKTVHRYPVTVVVAIQAVAATMWSWHEHTFERFAVNVRVWEHWELWRAWTSTLPHVNLFHLGFNLYWFWALGTIVERVYGHVRFLGIVILLAFGSALAEFALMGSGVGLSGVVYGLWGLLWVLARRDTRFTGAMDRQTSQTFVGWFVICIVLTLTNVMRVGNIAHGVGAVLGVLLGRAATGTKAVRTWSIAALASVSILAAAGSTVWWPAVNLSGYASAAIEARGLDALACHDLAAAEGLLTIASNATRAPARAWYNLGVAKNRLKKHDEALAAFEQAARMPDATSEFKKVAEEMRQYLGRPPK